MNVIIAEDDYRVAMLHTEYLKAYDDIKMIGHALNGDELLKLLEKKPDVSLILLDLYFPDVMGTELLGTIRANYPHVDIIIISASDDRSALQQAKRHGVYAFLTKPVEMKLFQVTIKHYLDDRAFFTQKASFTNDDARRLLGGSLPQQIEPRDLLPTGIDAITLDHVYQALVKSHGLTIEETCEKVGISRTTARRYLEYLVRENKIETRLNYGVIGRPERKYVLY